jgi:predicted dehydrogenase
MSNNRREFLKSVTAAGAAAIAGAPAILAQRSPNDTIGVACIGVGTRGHQLLQEIQACPGTEVRVVCDLYDGHIARARKLNKNPKAVYNKDWEETLANKDIDVVTIATPDFWHAPIAIRAAESKKDIYVEKGLCMDLKEAKALRKAVRDNQRVLQLGHHYNGMPVFHKAREIWNSGELGKVPMIRMYIDRTGQFPEWQFYGWYATTELPKDANEQTIDWQRFIRKASKRPFDAERFFRWRCWWEYGNGIAGDLMSHMWDSVNMVTGAGIPETVMTMGNLYWWKQDREVADQWHVMMDYPKKELAMTFGCTFANRHVGEIVEYLGREKTMEVSPEFCRVYDGEWKQEYLEKKRPYERRQSEKIGLQRQDAARIPDYSYKEGELKVTDHMQDFVDCVRSRETPRCGMDRAFEELATIVLSMESYRKQRKVKWNAATEEVEVV